MENVNLVGYWQLQTTRARSIEGEWVDEKVYGGSLVFSPGGNMVVFFNTSEGPYGYCGTYSIQKNEVTFEIKAGIADDMNGVTVTRSFEFLNQNQIMMTGIEIHTGHPFEVTYSRST